MASDKLYKMRLGSPPHKHIKIRGESFEVVLLSSDIIRQIEEQVELYAQKNKDRVNDTVRALYYDSLLTYHALRDSDDPSLSSKVVDNPEDISAILDPSDIAEVTNAYSELMMNKAPKIELLNQEEMDEVKKHLEVTPLKELSTVLLVHLRNCHQTIVSER